ncbi:hypothetical protein SBV1_1180007 [Verrucomicrobia bacterium]|nr:hypothetical protein SBV1_1180007 [Verrucomicrobiota bacterium]
MPIRVTKSMPPCSGQRRKILHSKRAIAIMRKVGVNYSATPKAYEENPSVFSLISITDSVLWPERDQSLYPHPATEPDRSGRLGS